MAGVYNLEPHTQGKVVLHTSHGDVDIEFWPKEAPKAVRNFVQLCMEGYYDETIFHRVIKGFMIQGGDPTGTGLGGESIYGRPFKDEFHSRLRFTRRGLVACANQNETNTNGSQFFITLDKTEALNRKHTIFGTVTGDTIFNVTRIGDVEVGEEDRPLEPPVIKSVEVLWNPFEDIQPRITAEERRRMREEQQNADKKKKSKGKGKKALKLLSFGDEAAEDETELQSVGGVMLSAHDTLDDARLAKEHAEEVAALVEAAKQARAKDSLPADEPAAASGAERKPKKPSKRKDHSGDDVEEDEEDDDAGVRRRKANEFDERMREKALARRQAMGDAGRSKETTAGDKGYGGPNREADSGDDEKGDEQYEGGTEHRRQMALESSKATTAVVRPSKRLAVQDSELLTDWQRKRSEYKARKRMGGDREKATLQRLAKFQTALKEGAQPAAAGKSSDEVEVGGTADEGDAGYDGKVRDDVDHELMKPAAWRVDSYLNEKAGGGVDDLRGHVLKFAAVAGDDMARTDNVDDYIVIDPLLEQAKEKFNQQQAKAKKRADREWNSRAIS